MEERGVRQLIVTAVAVLLVVAGCSHREAARRESQKEFANALFNPPTQTKEEQERHARALKAMNPVSGKGKVLAIDQDLGIGTMEFHGKPVRFWWKNRAYQASVREQAWKDQEVRETDVPFEASVGDTVYFRGVESRGEIYVTAAAVRR
jgi:hypothetical protein